MGVLTVLVLGRCLRSWQTDGEQSVPNHSTGTRRGESDLSHYTPLPLSPPHHQPELLAGSSRWQWCVRDEGVWGFLTQPLPTLMARAAANWQPIDLAANSSPMPLPLGLISGLRSPRSVHLVWAGVMVGRVNPFGVVFAPSHASLIFSRLALSGISFQKHIKTGFILCSLLLSVVLLELKKITLQICGIMN